MQCIRRPSVTACSRSFSSSYRHFSATIQLSSPGLETIPVPTSSKARRPRKVVSELRENPLNEPIQPRRRGKGVFDTTVGEIGQEQTVRKTRTRKKYADLPVQYSPAGSPLAPLPADWKGATMALDVGTEEPKHTSPIMPSEDKLPLQSSRTVFPRTQLAFDITENLAKFPHCILLTRVGNFYESYFDQAIEVARLLTIKLTTRSWGGQRVPMCGFPLAHLDRHLKRLVQTNKRFAAVCEEFRRRDGSFERRVVRVVTPGTLIDESFVDHFENNYLLAVSTSEGREFTPQSVGLAWTDVATGEFYSQTVSMDSLRDEIARIGPRELVLSSSLKSDSSSPIQQALAEEEVTVSYIDLPPDPYPSKALTVLEHMSSETETEPSTPVCSHNESSAIALLTGFLQESLLEHMPHIAAFSPTHQSSESRVHIDAHTIKALELREGNREGGVTGSLMSAIKRTVTSSGTRLLGRWLCSPSTVASTINSRQALVAVFHSLPHLRNDLVRLLKQSEDATRIVQKFLLGKGDMEDLLAIRDTIRIWSRIRDITESELDSTSTVTDQINLSESDKQDRATLRSAIGTFADLRNLAEKIDLAVDESVATKKGKTIAGGDVEGIDEAILEGEDLDIAPQATSLGGESRPWSIKPQFSSLLTGLHDKLSRLYSERTTMELDLQVRCGVSSLALGSATFQGWHVRITKTKNLRNLGELSELGLFEVSRSASSRTYLYAPWTALGTSLMETEAAIYQAEKAAFASLRSEVKIYGTELRRNGRISDELDVALAFANLAEELKLVRPTLDNSNEYNVVNGRHPAVELGLLNNGRNFVPNSVHLHPRSRLHVITGPNMAGKSTLLRQTALIAILAQTGSFVPAEFARIGIVDKVFSRIGAKDDIYRDRSTFMVEMLETAEILKKATEKSLVIMDEVGRGTTVKDGLAIAFATIHHLYTVNKCRTLFATHFHNLADMLGYNGEGLSSPHVKGVFPDVDFYCTDVDEIGDGYFTYSHRMHKGVNRDSHGLKVAQMAGMPTGVIAIALETLERLQDEASTSAGIPNATAMRSVGEAVYHSRQ